MGFVPEERSIINALSTRDNLRMGRGGVEDACELFPELVPLLDRRAGLLSGGEQQMLALGRALAARPSLLLVDELSLGLAPMIVDRLLLAVRAAADRGVGVLLVEQHTAGALSIADYALVLRRGRVEMRGTAADVHARVEHLQSTYLSHVG